MQCESTPICLYRLACFLDYVHGKGEKFMGDYEVFALDWGVSLKTVQKVEADMTHVAIRGHWIQPAQEAGKNCIAFEAAEYVETTFEQQYLVKSPGFSS